MNGIVNPVQKVDFTFLLIFGISIIILILITFLMVYFIVRYNRKRNPEPADIEGNTLLEIIWTVIPTIVVLGMFYAGWDSFKALRNAPSNSLQIKVEGKMWSWRFIYPDGKVTNELYVPVNKPVRLNITSLDVLHSFYVPAFRIKIDSVPGMQTYAWFQSDKTGDFDILCAEYCGTRHAYMLSKVHVLSDEEFEKWLKGSDEASSKQYDTILKKHGCFDCHSTDGSVIVGPSFKDIFNRETEILEGGKSYKIKADESYLKESILEPNKKVVKGFEPVMPSYKGVVTDDELEMILKYFKGELGKLHFSAVEGKKVFEREGCNSCHSTDGSIIAAPTFKGLYDSKRTVVKSGKDYEVLADEDYLYVAIKYPEREIVKGFDNIMPSFSHLKDEDVKNLIEFIKTLK